MQTTNNQEWNNQIIPPAPPLTPTVDDGEVQFLGPDMVKYISPPRKPQMPSHFVAPPHGYQVHPYQQFYPQHFAYPPPQQVQPPPQQMMFMPHGMMMQPVPQMMQPQMVVPQIMPQVVAATPQAPAPVVEKTQPSTQNINVVVNSPPTGTLPGGLTGTLPGSGSSSTLLCPKCRSGIITRKDDKKRRRQIYCLTIFCFLCNFGLLLCCLRCNHVDTCGACGKKYGHRGKKAENMKVNAVTL